MCFVFGKMLGVARVLLKDRFRKLFMLSVQKNLTVIEMGGWEQGRKTWYFQWRRPLSLREGVMLEELRQVVDTGVLVEGLSDSFIWTAEPTGCYTMQSAYRLL